jgi:hypothetical protein
MLAGTRIPAAELVVQSPTPDGPGRRLPLKGADVTAKKPRTPSPVTLKIRAMAAVERLRAKIAETEEAHERQAFRNAHKLNVMRERLAAAEKSLAEFGEEPTP